MSNPTAWKQAAYKTGRGLGARLTGDAGNFSLLGKAADKAACVELTTAALVARVTAFHDERLAAVPDLSVYPELRDERDILLEKYRGMADEGMTREMIALCESLDFWCSFRCHAETGKWAHGSVSRARLRERCRSVYAPETDRGGLHMKNVDDPLQTWHPLPLETPPGPWPFKGLVYDGVGSGVHIDDVPPEIFPADAREICGRHCTTVDEAEEMLIRYNYFWGSANLVIHDSRGNAVAIDKASRCHYAVRRQGPSGVIYINGMSSFDDDYQAWIEARRSQYLAESGQDETSPEGCYFAAATGTLHNMRRRMREFEAAPTFDSLREHMSSHDADGPLCRPGLFCHPDDPISEATLFQRLFLLDEHVMMWRQWVGDTPVWEDDWKTVQYPAP